MKSALLSQLFWVLDVCLGNPSSHPYVPFRTSPFEQKDDFLHHDVEIPPDTTRSRPKKYDQASAEYCPLQFNLGLSQRAHHVQDTKSTAIIEPPSIFPVHSSLGPGRQVIHSTQYEHLDLLTPAMLMGDASSSSVIKEGLIQHQDFPLLFESSSFLGSPLVHDTNGDGIADAILADYDGGIYFVGLQVGKDHRRFLHKAQIPRLFVRREWMKERLNETLRQAEAEVSVEEVSSHNNDPYHSYFEYGSHENRADGVLQAVPANLLVQDHEDVSELERRRNRKFSNEVKKTEDQEKGETQETQEEEEVDEQRRRLDEMIEEEESGSGNENMEEGQVADDDDYNPDEGQWPGAWPDDDAPNQDEESGDSKHYDDDYGGAYDGDDYSSSRYEEYYGSKYGSEHNNYYDEEHYIRIPPHLLSTPVLADLKKMYSEDNEREEMLFFAVSYYFDEDEYEGHFSYKRFENTDKGDENEMDRGMYVATALMAYVLDGSPRFGREEHLDLSGDSTAPHNVTILSEIPMVKANKQIGAFALSPPSVADIDGNGDEDIIMGTSMGIIYCLHARHMYNTEGWPIQIQNPIESRILLEDVLGDTNLEIFVLDGAGNIYCFNARGEIIWRRDLINSIAPESEIRGISPMTMGDVDSDGMLDIVVSIKLVSAQSQWSTFVVALSAVTGADIENFPIEFDSPLLVADGTADAELTQKLPQPLLIDLHADQSNWKAYLARNGTAWTRPKPTKKASNPPHGGSAPGLHVVQPIGTNLYIIEGGSGCTQMISIGEEISAMVQADDVHGTNNIDLVISTKSGSIITLDSPAVPYHPLNVWNSGEVRSRRNNFAQGFSASQGIFVHERSRQYRDIFGVYVPVTFEIFDNRPSGKDKRIYNVEFRDGTSAKRAMFRKVYTEPGVYTERFYISYGPGYYTITVLLRTSHGLIYEDSFHLGYNVHYMDGFGLLLWLPLLLSAIVILTCSKRKADWDDEEYDVAARGRGNSQGILGAS